MAKPQPQAPVYINLTGAFTAHTHVAGKPCVLDLKEDGRLLMLEAFLTALANTAKSSASKGDHTLSSALRAIVQKTDPSILAHNDIVLEITSKIDPERHEVTHNFKVTAQARK